MDKLKFQERYKAFSKYLDETYHKKLNITTDELFDRIESDCLTFCNDLWADAIITNPDTLEFFKLWVLSSIQINRFAAISVYG